VTIPMPDGTGFSGNLGLKGQPGPQNVRGGVDSQYAGEVCQTRRTAIHPSPERDNPLAEG